MPSPLAHLQGSLDFVFAQVVLELHEVLHGALVITQMATHLHRCVAGLMA